MAQPAPDQAAQPHQAAPASNQGGPALLGTLFGLRTVLGAHGITLNLSEASEVLANATGGIHRNAAYDGLTTGTLRVDSQAALGYAGGTFNISALQYHGRNYSADTLLTLQTASGIEADRATRLWELWYDQMFWDKLVDLKLGQQSLDSEFMVSSNALLFINTAFGWPVLPSYDLPGGGPAYPLSSLGVRLRAQLGPHVTMLGGIYNGSPASQTCTNPDAQICNPSGTSFPLDGDQLIIGEVQYAFPGNGDLVRPGSGNTPAGTYKLGFWVDTESFPDQRTDTRNLPLAALDSTGIAKSHSDNWSIYGVLDQQIWQQPMAGPQSVSVFGRAMAAPADRNLISLSLNAGVIWHAPILQRDADSLGLAIGYTKISPSARGADRDQQRLTGAGFARSDETFIEATYQFAPFDWWQIQPDVQYVFNPGARIADPLDPARKIRNEAVFGFRTNIVF